MKKYRHLTAGFICMLLLAFAAVNASAETMEEDGGIVYLTEYDILNTDTVQVIDSLQLDGGKSDDEVIRLIIQNVLVAKIQAERHGRTIDFEKLLRITDKDQADKSLIYLMQRIEYIKISLTDLKRTEDALGLSFELISYSEDSTSAVVHVKEDYSFHYEGEAGQHNGEAVRSSWAIDYIFTLAKRADGMWSVITYWSNDLFDELHSNYTPEEMEELIAAAIEYIENPPPRYIRLPRSFLGMCKLLKKYKFKRIYQVIEGTPLPPAGNLIRKNPTA